MSQIKYLANAFLLLLLLCALVFTVDKLSSAEIIARQPAMIDVDVPATTTTTVKAGGKNLFSANCATCHALDKTLTGPALRGVTERGPWTERKNLLLWVRNPAATIPKFAYTKALAAQFNGQVMPSFPQLTDGEIEAIFAYIQKVVPAYPAAPLTAME